MNPQHKDKDNAYCPYSHAKDIEKLKEFYIKYFRATSNEKYTNATKGFESYFLTFNGQTTLEIMKKTSIAGEFDSTETFGLTHIAFSVGSKETVDKLTATLIQDGYTKLDGSRYTGDGYYESLFLDPENNRIEITI
ncbi:MAG: VOC family protein [Alphaproteobacteria bacterium]